jgi:hypothetical protein
VGFIAYSAKIIVGMFSGGGMLAVSTAAYLLAVLFALTAMICWAVFKPLRRLLLTALRPLTLPSDTRELRLHTRGFGGYADVSWPRERILDVLVRYRQAVFTNSTSSPTIACEPSCCTAHPKRSWNSSRANCAARSVSTSCFAPPPARGRPAR